VALAATVGLATALRVHDLSAGPWFDEIVTHVRYARMPFAQIVTTYDFQNQHFLYTLLARASMALFGDGVWQLRLPAVLFGVGSVGALALLARRLTGARETLLATLLLAVSYHHVWFSQNARGYTGLLFFTIVSSTLLLRGLAGGGVRVWLLYALAVALGMYTHLTMLFVVAGHALMIGWRALRPSSAGPRARLEGLVFGLVPAGLLTLALYAPVLPQMFGGTLHEGSAVAQWKNPMWALVEFVSGMRLGLGHVAAGLAAAVVFVAGCWRAARRSPVLLELFFFPVAICGAVVVARGHHLWPRFFFFAAGFAVLIAVLGAMQTGAWLGRLLRLAPARSEVLGTALAAGILLGSAATVPRAWAPKQDFRGAMRYLQGRVEPGDAVVTVGLATLPYRDYYETGWVGVETVDELEALRGRAARTWLVYTLPFHLEAFYPQLYQRVEGEFTVIATFPGTLGGGEIYVCLDKPGPHVADDRGRQPHPHAKAKHG